MTDEKDEEEAIEEEVLEVEGVSPEEYRMRLMGLALTCLVEINGGELVVKKLDSLLNKTMILGITETEDSLVFHTLDADEVRKNAKQH